VVEREGPRRLVGITRRRLTTPDDPVVRIPQPAIHPPVRAAVDRLEDVFAAAITLVDSEPLRECKRAVLGDA
jgi:hypothetical protein